MLAKSDQVMQFSHSKKDWLGDKKGKKISRYSLCQDIEKKNLGIAYVKTYRVAKAKPDMQWSKFIPIHTILSGKRN